MNDCNATKHPQGRKVAQLEAMAFRGNLDQIKALLQRDPQLVHQSKKGWTALMWAAANGHADCVDYLIEHSDPHAIEGEDSMTALLIAVEARGTPQSFRCVQSLLGVSDARVQDRSGRTALMLATLAGEEFVRLLLPVSDWSARDHTGARAIDWAVSTERWECADWLGDPLTLRERQELLAKAPDHALPRQAALRAAQEEKIALRRSLDSFQIKARSFPTAARSKRL